jgi:anti-sigma B factor antagonist
MHVHQEIRQGRLILRPDRALLCAGPAEQFELLLQEVLAAGHRHLIVACDSVPHMDSGGVRALVRGYLTAQRLGGSLALANVDRRVNRVLTLMRLDLVFPIYETVEKAIAAAPEGV